MHCYTLSFYNETNVICRNFSSVVKRQCLIITTDNVPDSQQSGSLSYYPTTGVHVQVY